MPRPPQVVGQLVERLKRCGEDGADSESTDRSHSEKGNRAPAASGHRTASRADVYQSVTGGRIRCGVDVAACCPSWCAQQLAATGRPGWLWTYRHSAATPSCRTRASRRCPRRPVLAKFEV